MVTIGQRLAPRAFDIVGRLGFAATIYRDDGAASYDPTTGAATPDRTPHLVKITPPSPVNIESVDGTLVLHGDMETLCPAQGLAIAPDPTTDTLAVDGEEWRIVRVSPVHDIGGGLAAHIMQVRK